VARPPIDDVPLAAEPIRLGQFLKLAGLAEDGGQGWKAQIGFRGVPVRREDQHDLHLPAAGGFQGLTMQQNQFFGGPFALRILHFHEGGSSIAPLV